MRREEFPFVTLVAIVSLALATAWQVHRAMDFSNGFNAIRAWADQPPVDRGIAPVELPDFKREVRQGCITVFRPPKMRSAPVYPDGFRLVPRPQFRILRLGEKEVDLQLNREGIRVVGLKLGGYFRFQGERYQLIELKAEQVSLRQLSNRRRFIAYAGAEDPRRQHEHHL